MKIDVLTLFPGMFTNFMEESIVGIAIKNKAIQVNLTNIRDFAFNKHRNADDYPYGGGAGMVMKPEPLYESIMNVKQDRDIPVIYFTPQGKLLTQRLVEEFSKQGHKVYVSTILESRFARATEFKMGYQKY